MSKIQQIINNRTVFILLHGKSIEQLERCITSFQDKDVCYASLNSFNMMEDYILSKINKQLDIVFDCSTVVESRLKEYENMRVSRIDKYLDRQSNNIWITSYGLIRDLQPLGYHWFTQIHKDKILQVDSIFPKDKISYYMQVPNSVTLLIASCMYGNAKNIVIFGLDGYKGEVDVSNTYYKSDIQKQERILAIGSDNSGDISRDTDLFEKNFDRIYNQYKLLFGNINIYNCSPNSVYTVLPKITYEQIEEYLI